MSYTVYRSTNSINGKSYVGVDFDWPTARMTHESARGDTDLFHRALRQYGPPLFRWEALLHTEDVSEANEMVASLYKDTLAPGGYNTHATFVTNEIEHAPILEERKIFKVDVTDMPAQKAQEIIKETIDTIRKGAITDEGRRRISEAVSKPVSIDGIMYRSIKEASEQLGIPRHQVKMVIKGINSVEYYRQKAGK